MTESIDEDETGRPFLVMELLNGSPLVEWLTQEQRHWTDVTDLFIGVGEGLVHSMRPTSFRSGRFRRRCPSGGR